MGVFALAMLVLAGVIVVMPGRGKLNAQRRAMSADGELMAFALPYHGAASGGYEDGLIIFLSGKESTVMDRHQTSLKGTRGTRLEWVAEARPERFRIFDEKGTRMVWQVEGKRMVCVEGRGFLVEKPEERDE